MENANRAHQRRYLQIGEVVNGLARIEGQLVPEAVAKLRTAMEPLMKPAKGDQQTAGQRAHDALVELCVRTGATAPRGGEGRPSVGGSRPLVIITASLDTLAGLEGAPARELERGGPIPAETGTDCA